MQTILKSRELGIIPNEDITLKFRDLIKSLKNIEGKKILELEKGIYFFDSKKIEKEKFYITNTIADSEYKRHEEKHMHSFAILLRDIDNLVINANNSTFIMDGVLTNIAIINSKNILIKDLTINTKNPNMHTFKVINTKKDYIDFLLDKDSIVQKNRFNYFFIGKDYKTNFLENSLNAWWIGYSKENSTTLKRHHHPFRSSLDIKRIKENIFRVYYFSKPKYEISDTFTFFENRRIEQGILIDSSLNITLENIKQTFNYGLSLVCQNSIDVSLLNSKFVPENKAMTSVADFVQISMCRGIFNIKNNVFESSGDDVLNIHGFHFAIKKVSKNKIVIKFMHKQSKGFLPFKENDEINLVNRDTLLVEDKFKVLGSKLISPKYIELILDRDYKLSKKLFVENQTAKASLNFENNIMSKIATRGLLITTSEKVNIFNNIFKDTSMHSILISNDARTWYESGFVNDVNIKNNIFEKTGGYILQIKPENKIHKGYVHKNINFENNLINIEGEGGFFVKSSENVVIKNNKTNKINKENYIIDSKVELD